MLDKIWFEHFSEAFAKMHAAEVSEDGPINEEEDSSIARDGRVRAIEPVVYDDGDGYEIWD